MRAFYMRTFYMRTFYMRTFYMRTFYRAFACSALLIPFSLSVLPASAQTDFSGGLTNFSGGLNGASSRGTFKVQARNFDPFLSTRRGRPTRATWASRPPRISRFAVSRFGLPAKSRFSAPLFDPFSSSASPTAGNGSAAVNSSSVAASSSPIVVAPITQGQTSAIFAASGFAASGSSSGFPSIPRPVRSPYRPPPRPALMLP